MDRVYQSMTKSRVCKTTKNITHKQQQKSAFIAVTHLKVTVDLHHGATQKPLCMRNSVWCNLKV